MKRKQHPIIPALAILFGALNTSYVFFQGTIDDRYFAFIAVAISLAYGVFSWMAESPTCGR